MKLLLHVFLWCAFGGLATPTFADGPKPSAENPKRPVTHEMMKMAVETALKKGLEENKIPREDLEKALKNGGAENNEINRMVLLLMASNEPRVIDHFTKSLNDDVELGEVKNAEAVLGEIDKYMMRTLKRTREQRNLRESVTRAEAASKAMLGYANEHEGRLPPADKWGSNSKQWLQTPRILHSPQLPITDELRMEIREFKIDDPNRWELGCHYAINKAVAGRLVEGLGARVLIFECDLGWNGSGGLADAKKYMAKHKLTAIAVGFTDGTARQATLEELPKLKW